MLQRGSKMRFGHGTIVPPADEPRFFAVVGFEAHRSGWVSLDPTSNERQTYIRQVIAWSAISQQWALYVQVSAELPTTPFHASDPSQASGPSPFSEWRVIRSGPMSRAESHSSFVAKHHLIVGELCLFQ
jgi:hypothetical protein